MSNALRLVATSRQEWSSKFEEDVRLTWSAALEKDNHYTLFRWSDWPAWVAFTVVFAILIILDNGFLNRKHQAMSMKRAAFMTVFWILCAGGFCFGVYKFYDRTHAFMWMSGYMLEWMLSFDNIFVFHMIFSVYATPDHLKHKPLYYGIVGAVFFRLIFIFIGEFLMHAMYLIHFVFGAFLVYTGVKTMTADDEDEDPSQQPLVQWLQRKVAFISLYDSQGYFFVRVPVDTDGNVMISTEPTESSSLVSSTAAAVDSASEDGDRRSYCTIDVRDAVAKCGSQGVARYEWRATMLFLVVCCLEICDVLFAVDSVSAIVAQVPDLFLAYTSAVFAMLGLRATFFIVDALVHLFELLKYGVGAVLVFVGIKLIGSNWYHVPPSVVCAVLVTCVGSAMIASVGQDWMQKQQEAKLAAEKLVTQASPMMKQTAYGS
jgi:tellurite resistance protein TerC